MQEELMNISNNQYQVRSIYNHLQVSYARMKQGWLTLMLVIMLVFSFSPPAIAAQSTTATQNKAIALRFAQEGWGTKPNWEKTWDEVVNPNVIYHFNSSPEPIVGLPANKEFSKSLFQGFPNIRQKIEDAIAEGDKVVYRTTIQGTNTGEFLGTPSTGKPVKVNDFTMLRFANGQIAEMWYECNLLEVMQQLDLVPRPS
jgi:predicted ester cyclase